jgi:hypothetical protein
MKDVRQSPIVPEGPFTAPVKALPNRLSILSVVPQHGTGIIELVTSGNEPGIEVFGADPLQIFLFPLSPRRFRILKGIGTTLHNASYSRAELPIDLT